MKIVGRINLEIVNIVEYGKVFAYSENGEYPHLYMKVDPHKNDFYNALQPFIDFKYVIAFNLEDGCLVQIPKDTRVLTYPTATINIENNCPDNS